MEKLLELQFLDILPTRSGFLFVRREILDETQIRLSFHEFLLHTSGRGSCAAERISAP